MTGAVCPTQRKALDAGCNRPEGKNPTPYERNEIMTIVNDTAVESNPNPHPELPRAPWTNERFDDDLGCVIDRLCIDRDEYEIRIEQIHHPVGDGLESLPPDVIMRWEQQHADGSNREDLCIPLGDVPRLIVALQSVIDVTEVSR